jgi:sortase A
VSPGIVWSVTDANTAVDDDDGAAPDQPASQSPAGRSPTADDEPSAALPTLPPRDPGATRDEPLATPSLPRLTNIVRTEVGEPQIPQPRLVAREPIPVAAPAERRPRVSRWDRPREPRDWRFYVGAVGRILIAVGVLMFGFVGYQLWGTGLETARAQNRLEDRFESLVATAGSTVANTSIPDATTPDATTPELTTPGATLPTATVPPASPPVGTVAPTPAAPQQPAVIEDGQPLARLEIPAIDQDVIVVPGVDHESLKDGPGHYPDTPLPGQLGNAAIAGHRTTWSEPFARIDELEPGDEIIVTMITGARYVYIVDSTQIVSPSDYWIVGTTDPTVAQLTLTSCHPRWSASQRIAVTAFLAPEVSAPVAQPTFYDLDGDEDDTNEVVATIPGDVAGDPVTSSPATVPDGDTASAGTVPGAPVPTIATPVDGLTEGWFNDSGAWLHILLWALGCAAIARFAYLVSRRARSYPIGLTVSVLPFLVALYFLYQNINRLLPPGL